MNHYEVAKHTRSNARDMRKQMTDAELKLWNELRAHRLMGLSFRRQMPVGKYIVDFACPKHKLIIEVDGSGHGEYLQRQHDSRRTLFIESKGWKIIRYWNDDVLKNIDDVCTNIIATLHEMGVKFK